MWIIPKNYQPSSVFAVDMLESKEDLSLPGLDIESSLMWRSKPSPLRTWSQRWKRENWLRHLFGRILKPSQHIYFEEQLTSSLAVTRANRSARQVSERESQTQDIFGQLFGDTHKQLDLLGSSLKMSKDTFRLDSPASLATWKKIVIEQRGEYSQRVKLAHHIRESEFLSWPTPAARDYKGVRGKAAQARKGNPIDTLPLAVKNYPTQSAHEARLGYQDRSDPTKKGTQESLTTVVVNNAGGRTQSSGHLNPDWVEWLMGVPTGYTALGSWGMQ